MKYLAGLLLFMLSVACTNVSAVANTTGIPVSVSRIQMELVGDSVVRAIQHNMEINPIIQFELMSRPKFEVINTLTIREIPFNGETLNFRESSGAFIESVNFKKDYIVFVVDYFYLRGGSLLLSCKIPISQNAFAPLECRKK